MNYPDFIFQQRSNKVAVIFVTNEDEQSLIFKPSTFVASLESIYSEDKEIKSYGFFGFNDMPGCTPRNYAPNYEGSHFQEVIVQTGGFALSACSKTFKSDFIKIVRDL